MLNLFTMERRMKMHEQKYWGHKLWQTDFSTSNWVDKRNWASILVPYTIGIMIGFLFAEVLRIIF